MKHMLLSIFLMILLFSSAFLIVIPNSNKAYAATDVFLKSITRISGGTVFNSPLAIALDSSENIYVADSGNYRVAEVSDSGTFIKAFGTSGLGELNTTSGVALDSSGNVYVADSDNNKIVEFNNSGNFIKSFGSNKILSPSGVSVDSSGNVYVADTEHNQITEFNNSGNFIKSFGNNTLSSPSGISVDSSGKIYVADTGNNQIVEYDNMGNLVASFGSDTLSSPSGISVDSSGKIYVADTGNSQVVEYNGTGNLVTLFGSDTLSSPSGISVDSSGNIYIADAGNSQIVEYTTSGSFMQSFGDSGNLLLSLPSNVALNNTGDIFVADQGNDRILVFDNTGSLLFTFGSHGTANGQFVKPFGIAFDSTGNIYVVDTGNNRVEKFDSSGNFLSKFGSIGSGGGLFNQPLGIAIGNGGNIYVADTNNGRISKFSNSGTYVTSFGTGTLGKPTGVVFNAAGNFYVSDKSKNNVYEFNSVTGSLMGTFPNTNSSGISLQTPYGIGFDFPGNLHIVDSGNNRVVVLSGTGQLVTQFGSAGTGSGQFQTPSGLAIDASGNIYVADTANNRVDIFSPTVPPAKTITVNNPNPSSARWGIDSVSVSGHATSISNGDTVTVDWGDGSTTTSIAVSAFTGNWGPVTHVYPATASGQIEQIIGTIVNSGNPVATSSSVSVGVTAHHTSLTISNIPNVVFGGQITASGILTDTDANVGISNVAISFSGNNISILPVTTASDGSYSSVGTVLNSILGGLSVTANFAGNSQYLSSAATTSSFNTLQHHVALYIKPIPDSPWGSTITISGMLNDTDSGNMGINGKSITITGSGISTSQTVTTSTISGKAGSFSVTTTTPSNIASGLGVTATFSSDSNYIGNSISTNYNTIAHHTSLTLNSISNIVTGGTITASGVLKDTDANVGIVGSPITFNGTGVGTISSTSTTTGGTYSVSGTATSNVVSGLTIQAHYVGSQLYQNASSIIQTYSTGNAPSISINAPVIPNTLGGNQARWGVDPVSINGTASNSASGDMVTIAWGDSAVSSGIHVVSGKWGPLSHTYGPGAVGTNHIVATLVSSSNANKAVSAPLSIFVLQHTSTLTLNPISNVAAGGTFTVTGKLADSDTNIGISGESVTFTGTGVGTLGTGLTNATGFYTATGIAPSSTTNGLTVQAVFSGDLDVFPSNSTVQTYNTLTITSPPEAFNQFDPVTKDVLVYGVDSTGKIFGPIKPQSVTKTTWDSDDDKGGDHSKSGGQGHGDNDHNSGSQGHNDNNDHNSGYQGHGDYPRTSFQSYDGNSQIILLGNNNHNSGSQGHNDNDDHNSGSQGHNDNDDHNSGSQGHNDNDDHNSGSQGHNDNDDHNSGSQGHNDNNHDSDYQGYDDDHYYPGNDNSCDGLQAELRTFKIVDTAGNSLVLTEKVVKSNNQINVHVMTIQYQNGPVLPAPVNLKHFSWSLDKNNNIQELDQSMIVGHFILPTVFVHAEFSQGNNQTHIQVTQFGQHPQVLVKSGLDLIKMLTNKGSLIVQY